MKLLKFSDKYCKDISCPAEPGYIYPAFENSVDPGQLASEEAN